MQKKPLVATMTGVAGLLASGLTVSLLAFPADAGDRQLALKRDEETPDIVLVSDDDDDDDDASRRVVARDVDTTRSRASRTGNSGDRSRTGARSGRDDSRSGRAVRDWTHDGKGPKKRDWSANRTNDRSRNNTRR
ncbi:hypothetical protein [Nocardioides sp. SYSU DS0651]|uniref:hypothetical protein n=1 Tax=Nocardioides sp. SYSU DS0651 TaxID=3415955 RepID=UPI003F4BF0F4